ncbi:MAG: hypothetical protein DDT39_00998 [Firmicutes bacterium]|nr:hypothetical protein [candidate division NPL-UPA2 bacterium]
MPRQAREVSPTGYYHVMMRSIATLSISQTEKKPISSEP